MTLRKSFGFGALALALFVAAAMAGDGKTGTGTCAGHAQDGKAAAGCAQKCAGAAMTGCAMAKGASAAPGAAAGAGAGCCAMGKGAQAANAPVLPEGTEVKKVDVPGGVDLVFTGKDLPGIQAFLNAHIAQCGTVGDKKDKKAACNQTCTLASDEKSVTMSIRGENAQSCCAGMFGATDEKGSVKATAGQTCPLHAKPATKKS